MHPIGQRIRHRRRSLVIPMTQEQLAFKCGLTTRTIQSAENLGSSLRFESAIKIADSLGVSLDWLAGRSPRNIYPEIDVINCYERDFYPFSNFSSFWVKWKGISFPTSEQIYQWEKFAGNSKIQDAILNAPSAHDAFSFAQSQHENRVSTWDDIKIAVMRAILKAKHTQHKYVRTKLEQTGDREIIEKSWRDSFWGTGPDGLGQNWLGQLWMEIREKTRKV